MIRKGDVIEQETTIRSGPKQTLVVISTPCCKVTYRIPLADVEWGRDHNYPEAIWCGKRRNHRGNTPGQIGCRALYEVTFEGDPPTVAKWEWTGI